MSCYYLITFSRAHSTQRKTQQNSSFDSYSHRTVPCNGIHYHTHTDIHDDVFTTICSIDYCEAFRPQNTLLLFLWFTTISSNLPSPMCDALDSNSARTKSQMKRLNYPFCLNFTGNLIFLLFFFPNETHTHNECTHVGSTEILLLCFLLILFNFEWLTRSLAFTYVGVGAAQTRARICVRVIGKRQEIESTDSLYDVHTTHRAPRTHTWDMTHMWTHTHKLTSTEVVFVWHSNSVCLRVSIIFVFWWINSPWRRGDRNQR